MVDALQLSQKMHLAQFSDAWINIVLHSPIDFLFIFLKIFICQHLYLSRIIVAFYEFLIVKNLLLSAAHVNVKRHHQMSFILKKSCFF